jgi:hypothetical protein
MALNGLAGAGQAKTSILASKGIYAPESKATIQMFGGIFGKSKDKKPSTTSPTTRRIRLSRMVYPNDDELKVSTPTPHQWIF